MWPVTPDTRSVSLFTTDRERRLWTWTLAVVVAIYSTLDLARMLAGELRDRELLDATFLLGLLLIGGTIVTLALKTKPGRVEIGIALGVAAVYLLVFLRMAIPEGRRDRGAGLGTAARAIRQPVAASDLRRQNPVGDCSRTHMCLIDDVWGLWG
jgi:hypothetical protein